MKPNWERYVDDSWYSHGHNIPVTSVRALARTNKKGGGIKVAKPGAGLPPMLSLILEHHDDEVHVYMYC